jgi:hypothetical protein
MDGSLRFNFGPEHAAELRASFSKKQRVAADTED